MLSCYKLSWLLDSFSFGLRIKYLHIVSFITPILSLNVLVRYLQYYRCIRYRIYIHMIFRINRVGHFVSQNKIPHSQIIGCWSHGDGVIERWSEAHFFVSTLDIQLRYETPTTHRLLMSLTVTSRVSVPGQRRLREFSVINSQLWQSGHD